MEVVVILPGGVEVIEPAVIEPSTRGQRREKVDHRATAWAAAERTKFAVAYSDREQLYPVEVHYLAIRGGKVVREGSTSFYMTMPHRDPTQEEWDADLAASLAKVPPEFHDFITSTAHERGSGMDEVLTYTRSLASDLEKPCQRFAERLRSANR